MRKKLTKAFIKSLKKPLSDRVVINDSVLQGFQCVIYKSGAISFYLYRRVKGKPKRILIGRNGIITVDQARQIAARITAEIEAGTYSDVIKESDRTFSDLFEWYLENHAKPHKKSWKMDAFFYKKHLSEFASKSISDITRADIVEFHNRKGKESGQTSANNCLNQMRIVLQKAVEMEWIKSNPAAGVKHFKTESRERFLSADELPRFFNAVNGLRSDTARDFIFTCLFTGARKSNVLSMKWADINFEQKTWLIRSEESKNKSDITVVLSKEALEVLKFRKEFSKSEYVFPSYGKTGHLKDPYHSWKEVKKASGIKDIRIHDLRRTLASWQAAAGSSLITIGKSLGHKDPNTTAIYARLNLSPVSDSVQIASSGIFKAGNPEKNKKS